MLNDRAQILLKTLVERYISDGQPVGSRALQQFSGLDVSSATIRNVMADLADAGLLAQPHTSAGRVPSVDGYRYYAEKLSDQVNLTPDDEQNIQRYFHGVSDVQEFMERTSHVLSLVSQGVGVAVTLAGPRNALEHVHFQRLAALASEAMDLARSSEDPMDTRNALTTAGFAAVGQGRYQDALDAFGECVKICQRLGPSWQLATSQLNLGAVLLHVGRPGDADAAFAAGLRIYRQLGDDVFAARGTNQRARAALAQGDVERASALAHNALAEFASHAERQGIADGLETLAAVAAARSDPGSAATLAGAAAAIRETIAASQLPDLTITSRFLREAERDADPKRWRASWQAGRSLTAADAVAYALRQTP